MKNEKQRNEEVEAEGRRQKAESIFAATLNA
jgi:hypothetical protein